MHLAYTGETVRMVSLYGTLFICVCIPLLLHSHVAKYYTTTAYTSRENSKRTDLITIVLLWSGSEPMQTSSVLEPNHWFSSASQTNGSVQVQQMLRNFEPVLNQFEPIGAFTIANFGQNNDQTFCTKFGQTAL